MLQSVRMGSSTGGHIFRTDLGTKSAAFTKIRYLPNRVPDETKLLVDSVFDLDTSKVLNAIGIFKLFLVVPMLVLGIILISVNSAEIQQYAIEKELDKRINASQGSKVQTPDELRATRIGNESLAPVWTGIMLAASAATDFIAVWRRRGSTIILHTFTSTITFVASILCIEYDRLQMTFLWQANPHGLKYKLYLSCVVLASIAVAVGVLSIYVGSRMGALEESRLYMEREGKKAVLEKRGKISWLNGFYCLARFVGQTHKHSSPPSLRIDQDSDVFSESSAEQLFRGEQSPGSLVLAPQNLHRSSEPTM